MSLHQTPLELEAKARIVSAPSLVEKRQPFAFDLHPVVHLTLAGCWLAFVGILVAAFRGPDLAIPAAIFAIGVVALFLTPGLWAMVVPDDGRPRQSFSAFLREGVETLTGPLAARDALAQIFTLPILLLGLALVMAAIKLSL